MEKTAEGVRRFMIGFGKKILIANMLGRCADHIYELTPAYISGGLAWTAALAYTFQIYYDFSGYSDMAIGLGRTSFTPICPAPSRSSGADGMFP